MDLKVLRTFVTAAHLQNFRETAERLSLSQPTVSAQMRELEAEVGEALFDRSGRRVRLNAAGEIFLKGAEEMLRSYRSAVQQVHEMRRGSAKSVSIAVSPEPARTLLPHALHTFLDVEPTVQVSVDVMPSRMIGSVIGEGGADIGIAQMPSDPKLSHVHSRELMRDRVVLVARRDDAGHDQEPGYWRHLLETQILLSYGHPAYWDGLLQVLERERLHPRTLTVTQVELTRRFVEEGLGVSFLPERAVQHEILEGLLMEVPTPGLSLPDAPTFLLLPDSPLTDTVRLFLDHLRESLQLREQLI